MKRKYYLTLGIVGILVAAFAVIVETGLIRYPMAWVEIGPSNLVGWQLKTVRPENAPSVVDHYMQFPTAEEKSGP